MKHPLLLFAFVTSFFGISQDLKSPSEFLGYELGSQFTRHHKVVDYYEYLSSEVPGQMKLLEYGQTNEQRPLLLAFVSSPENLKNLESIRQEHLQSTQGESKATKAIVWLSYNVHGNESVGTEASMQTIYELLTSKSDYLEDAVVILDPCMNPDGRDRYVNWYNQYKNTPYNVDPNSSEHHEGWWSGRSNHYMFDLNRDWAWLTQLESQQRIKVFNKWLPHVHVDFHEQGVDAPYYFAPAAEPYHEVITDFQRAFQVDIGKNHAKYFDANGWFYFTKEVFDLLYPSYGDTYPTYNGGVGMTYEQGGSGRAGLGIITQIGDTLTLKDRIAHHHTTGLSTVEISAKNAQRLNSEFAKFYKDKEYKYKSYALNGDLDKLEALTQLLDKHEIEFQWGKTSSSKGYDYLKGKQGVAKITDKTLVVHSDQRKGTLVKVLFEPNAKLSDSLTYDITAWSLPYAYGLEALATTSKIASGTGVNPQDLSPKATDITKDTYAYVTDWGSMKDARFLADLLQSKIRVRYALKPFKTQGEKYERGSLIITKADNKNHKSFAQTLKEVAHKHGVELGTTDTGFVESGKDFGSRYVKMVPKEKVAILSGKPTSTLRFGELWHFFEQQLHYPVTVLHSDYFDQINLWDYGVFILPGGSGYSKWLTETRITELKRWLKDGGKLIVMGNAIGGLAGKKGFGIKTKKLEKDSTANLNAFDTTNRERIKGEITGAIFKTTLDNTHPLAFGYGETYFTLKLGDGAYDFLDTGTVAYLEEGAHKPVAGFAGSKAQKKIAKTLVFGVEKHGKGQVIYMVDNPLFRGFWENGKLFMVNALFMVN